MINKPHRTEEQQEYRDNLAEGLKQLRNQWNAWKELAKTLIEEWKSTIEYLESISKNTEQWEEMVDDLAKNWEFEIEPSGMTLALDSEKDIITPVLYENSHMKSTLQKISTTDFAETTDNIISTYDEQWHCVVNFIYFSQIVSQHVFSTAKKKTEKEKEYKKILLKSDYLLPDWIAYRLTIT